MTEPVGNPPAEPESWADLRPRLERDSGIGDENAVQAAIAALKAKLEARGGAISDVLRRELIAFSFNLRLPGMIDEWKLAYGPMFTFGERNGRQAVQFPSLATVALEDLEYWGERARQCPHPIMRARYADLLWALPRGLSHLCDVRADVAMARAAADAYMGAAKDKRYMPVSTGAFRVARALTIGLEIGDSERIATARALLIELAAEAPDEDEGVWVKPYDLLIEAATPRLSLSTIEVDAIIADLESRLGRVATLPSDGYQPSAAQAAALRLARYYRRVQRAGDMRRVLVTYRDVILKMQGVAAPLVFAAAMDDLFRTLHDFQLREEAHELTDKLRMAGKISVEEMKPVESFVGISREAVDSVYEQLLMGVDEEALLRVIMEFLPRRANAEQQLDEMAKTAPLYCRIPIAIKDREGRTVAKVGSLDEDREGRLVHMCSKQLHLDSIWLRETMRRGTSQHGWTSEFLLRHVALSPLFVHSRSALLAAGLAAYHGGDAVLATHLLVPQIEAAVRQLARLIQAPLYRTQRSGRIELLSLDQLLQAQEIAARLGVDATMYLRVLLTDPRGWNVRNTVCHGMAEPEDIGLPVSDRVVHAVLLLACMRSEPGSNTDDAKPD